MKSLLCWWPWGRPSHMSPSAQAQGGSASLPGIFPGRERFSGLPWANLGEQPRGEAWGSAGSPAVLQGWGLGALGLKGPSVVYFQLF